jgi:small-conductance mechanosensitive channel
MDNLIDPQFFLRQIDAARVWLGQNALSLSLETLAQIGVVLIAFLAARRAAPWLRESLRSLSKGRRFEAQIAQIIAALQPLALPILWISLQWLSVLIAAEAGLPNQFINLVVSLITAWVVIRITASLVRDPVWSRFVALVAWSIAALNILNLLRPTMRLLDGLALTMGGLRISALTVVQAMLSLAVLLWLATLASRLFERRITTLPNLTPSLQVLFTKIFKIVLVVIAILAALRTVGIDVTAFAVFTGAVGLGIGFGLQKAVSNFISGIAILLDKSVKPGDVISVGDTFGWVQSLGARYVSVLTRDGREFLIPNEDLITQQVINWSYSTNQVRLHVAVSISYRADPHKAIALCIEAARETRRVLESPAPICLLKGFADSAIDLELRFWISDPKQGVSNVRSDVLLRVWDKFQAQGIEIPFPQRDLHIKAPMEVRVRKLEAKDTGEIIPGPQPQVD